MEFQQKNKYENNLVPQGEDRRHDGERTDIQIRKKRVTLPLLIDDMILFIEKCKDSIKTLLELIDKFSKVATCTINIQKSVVFLYTNKETAKKEI